METHDFADEQAWSLDRLKRRRVELEQTLAVPHPEGRRQAIAHELGMLSYEQAYREGCIQEFMEAVGYGVFDD